MTKWENVALFSTLAWFVKMIGSKVMEKSSEPSKPRLTMIHAMMYKPTLNLRSLELRSWNSLMPVSSNIVSTFTQHHAGQAGTCWGSCNARVKSFHYGFSFNMEEYLGAGEDIDHWPTRLDEWSRRPPSLTAILSLTLEPTWVSTYFYA
jgi:hypothetical protein